jgi:hypothetical protein
MAFGEAVNRETSFHLAQIACRRAPTRRKTRYLRFLCQLHSHSAKLTVPLEWQNPNDGRTTTIDVRVKRLQQGEREVPCAVP